MSKLSEYLKNKQANHPGERWGRNLWGTKGMTSSEALK